MKEENNRITLYHGSTEIVRTPVYGEGNPLCDYGLGLYLEKYFVENIDACRSGI